MARLGGLALASILALSAALGQAARAQRVGEPLDRIAFTLDAIHYRIEVPRASRLDAVQRPGCPMIWHPRAIRTMTFLELCSAPAAGAGRFAYQRDLGGSVRVQYNRDDDVGGGSGGTESELKGQLAIGGRTLALTCHDQGEWQSDPEWCLSYLGSLTIEK